MAKRNRQTFFKKDPLALDLRHILSQSLLPEKGGVFFCLFFNQDQTPCHLELIVALKLGQSSFKEKSIYLKTKKAFSLKIALMSNCPHTSPLLVLPSREFNLQLSSHQFWIQLFLKQACRLVLPLPRDPDFIFFFFPGPALEPTLEHFFYETCEKELALAERAISVLCFLLRKEIFPTLKGLTCR